MLRVNIPDNRVNGEALHQPAVLFRIHLPEFIRGAWTGETSAVHTLAKEQKTIPFPKKSFYLGRRPTTEKEQGIGYKQGHVVLLFNNGSQGINTETKIRVSANDVYTCEVIEVSILKHVASPSESAGGVPRKQRIQRAERYRRQKWKVHHLNRVNRAKHAIEVVPVDLWARQAGDDSW